LQVLVSLHDVTPAHRDRLDRAEALLSAVGVRRVAYLLVPDYHGSNSIARATDFHAWCARRRAYDVEWVLHGYFHAEAPAAGGGVRGWIARRTLTAGEGEFLALPAAEQSDRLRKGLEALAVLDIRPRAFVPPAWLSNDALHDALRDVELRYTEDHIRVFDVMTGASRAVPAISWSTRTPVRRIGSRLVCRALAHLTRRAPAIRIAIHPFDMDHAPTAAQIQRMLARVLRDREPVTYEALFRQAPG
jgi:predicted deacetylase